MKKWTPWRYGRGDNEFRIMNRINKYHPKKTYSIHSLIVYSTNHHLYFALRMMDSGLRSIPFKGLLGNTRDPDFISKDWFFQAFKESTYPWPNPWDWYIYIHSPRLTFSHLAGGRKPKRKGERLPTINCQVQAVSFRESLFSIHL